MKLNDIINLKTVGYPFSSSIDSLKKKNYFTTFEELKIEDEYNNLLLIIDPQNDFMEDGPLAVPGARQDMINLISFIYKNIKKIDKIKVSLDTHNYKQIFSQCWWMDDKGNPPEFFTKIDENSKYKPVFHKEHSKKYLKHLKQHNKELIIWPYHCILGTYGHNIEPNLEKMLSYFSLITQKKVEKITKGLNPMSEMYGIFKEEYSPNSNKLDPMLAKCYGKYQNIIIAGEAKSHCVLESIKQICQLYEYDTFNPNIILLENCTSSIEGFEKKTNEVFKLLESKYHIQIKNSKNLIL